MISLFLSSLTSNESAKCFISQAPLWPRGCWRRPEEEARVEGQSRRLEKKRRRRGSCETLKVFWLKRFGRKQSNFGSSFATSSKEIQSLTDVSLRASTFDGWIVYSLSLLIGLIGLYSLACALLGHTHWAILIALIELCPLSYTRPHSLGHTRVHSLFSPLVQFGPGHIQRLSSAFGRSELKEASLFALLSTRRLGDCAKSSRRRFLEGSNSNALMVL